MAINFNSEAGLEIRKAIEARLAELRSKNEDISLPERETAATRGGILELKRLLAPAPQYVAPLRYGNMRLNEGIV